MRLSATARLAVLGVGFWAFVACIDTDGGDDKSGDTDVDTGSGDTEDTDGGDTDDTDSDCFDITQPTFQAGSPGDSVDSTTTDVGVSCNWTVQASTDGWFVDGAFNVYETRFTQDYDEEHVLEEVAHDKDGCWSDLSVTLSTNAGFPNTPNTDTLFLCAELPTTNVENKATVAMRLYDADGNLTDCQVFGDDPDGVINNSFPSMSYPSDLNDANCTAI